jgi:hypothetical protein
LDPESLPLTSLLYGAAFITPLHHLSSAPPPSPGHPMTRPVLVAIISAALLLAEETADADFEDSGEQ